MTGSPTRRDLLRLGATAAVGSFLGCSSTPPARPAAPPPPFFHAEFAGQVGVAREDITPPVGIYARNWGAAKHDVAEGIHRPLTATALAMKSGGDPPLVLVALDLGWWKTVDDEQHIRATALRELGLDPARLMINMSHTHAGPATCREDRDKPGGELIAPYLDKVRDAVVRAIRRAIESSAEGTLTWSTGRCDLAVNRDLRDPAKDRWITGFNPSAAADDAVLVGRVSDAAGKVRAVLVNYACHPTSLAWENKLISPDYPGALRELVEKQVPGALCIYLHGPSGEVSPKQQYTGEAETADRNGRQLGYAALSTLEGMIPPRTKLEFAGVVESGAPLATWTRAPRTAPSTLAAKLVEVELPLKSMPSAAELEETLKKTEDRVQAERIRRKLRVRRVVGEGTTAKVPLWAWRVGDGYFIGQPNEAYTMLQTRLRATFPKSAISVLNLVNGSIGYLARAELFDQDLYQVWQSPFDRGCLELVVAAARTALKGLGAE